MKNEQSRQPSDHFGPEWKLPAAKPGSLHPAGSVDPLNDQPWPLRDVVQKLCEAAEILLHEKNYDGYGHEQISHALKVGRKWSSPSNEKVSA